MSQKESLTGRVRAHYGQRDLRAAVRAALAPWPDPSLDQLAPFDELHVGGRWATEALAAALPEGRDRRLLDLGAGIGGPARLLAATGGWRVTGIDLNERYTQVAADLTGVLGLGERASFLVADGLRLPFADGSFAAAASVHAAMNIPDKRALYGEVRRVLEPGASFAIFDLLAGSGGPVAYPVPWASEAATSFLTDPAALWSSLGAAGFQVVQREDRAKLTIDGLSRQDSQPAERALARAGLEIFIGPDYRAAMANLKRNLLEARVVPWLIVCRAC